MVIHEDIISLKAKVKAEMTRRSLNGSDKSWGSLETYGTDEYDFSEVPSSGSRILLEHGQKTVNILYGVKDIDNVSPVVEGGIIPPDKVNSLKSYVDSLQTETVEGSASSCRGACTGLCLGSCIGGCNGCSGQCNSGCQGCSGSCGTGCATGYMYA